MVNSGGTIAPQTFIFPGSGINIPFFPEDYDVIIGAMNKTFYRHYHLNDFPVNHPSRNFFDGKALGYAGTLSERYLRVKIVQ